MFLTIVQCGENIFRDTPAARPPHCIAIRHLHWRVITNCFISTCMSGWSISQSMLCFFEAKAAAIESTYCCKMGICLWQPPWIAVPWRSFCPALVKSSSCLVKLEVLWLPALAAFSLRHIAYGSQAEALGGGVHVEHYPSWFCQPGALAPGFSSVSPSDILTSLTLSPRWSTILLIPSWEYSFHSGWHACYTSNK